VGRLVFRRAGAGDAAAVAALHADSWRRHYRGAYADAFLDGDVLTDRVEVWTTRLSDPTDTACTVLAEEGDELVGFAHTILDRDATWGALLDNLHVVATKQRRGIGAALLARAASFVVDERPASPLYLWVLEQNRSAQAFYAALGGKPADTEPVRPVNGVPGRLNGLPVGIRYVWPDPTSLAHRD
jgi:GNAT superfamily N-acetyltransferase